MCLLTPPLDTPTGSTNPLWVATIQTRLILNRVVYMQALPPAEPVHSPRRWRVAGGVFIAATLVFIASYLSHDHFPWWSSALSNIAGAMLLLIPAEIALELFRSQVAATQQTAEAAAARAEVALDSAERTAKSLADVREGLIAQQTAELDAEIATYERVTSDASRATLLTALRLATERQLITAAGVRVPVWWTDLHYRFVITGSEDQLIVRLENDDQTVVSECSWRDDESAEAFYGRLVMAVRDAGQDLGTGLNDPTESISQLITMLTDVARLRSQEPMGNRSTLRRIIERRDGWYFTENLIIPADRLHYTIAVGRLNELDWEMHLSRRDWDNNPADAIQFAHRMYGIQPRSDSPAT